MKSKLKSIKPIMAVLAMLALVGCGGKNSQIDDLASVDVCQALGQEHVKKILGPLNGAPKSTHAQGYAGSCTWSFQGTGVNTAATLDVAVITRASADSGMNPLSFFEESQSHARAKHGADPVAIKDLGDLAYLYVTRDAAFSQLWFRQGETVIMFSGLGASAPQLEAFARALVTALMEKK